MWIVISILGVHSLHFLVFIELHIFSWLLMKDVFLDCSLQVQKTSNTIRQFGDYLESLQKMYEVFTNNLVIYFSFHKTLRLWSSGLWHGIVFYVDINVTFVTTPKPTMFYICITYLYISYWKYLFAVYFSQSVLSWLKYTHQLQRHYRSLNTWNLCEHIKWKVTTLARECTYKMRL
jgi:hypothetical protein